MPLITCLDCGHSVSDRAPACPNCGAPITAKGPGEAKPVVTELTSKRLKRQVLLSALTIVVGVVWVFSVLGASNSSSGAGSSTIGALLILTGLVWFAATRIRIWWQHK